MTNTQQLCYLWVRSTKNSYRKPMAFDREQHPTLVIGLAGRIGAGVSFARDKIQQQLRTFGYDVALIDVSKTFLTGAYDDVESFDPEMSEEELDLVLDRRESAFERDFPSKAQRIAQLQERGNALRAKLGNDGIAKLCIQVIDAALNKERRAAKQAFVIDSLKRPEEVDLFREIFCEAFLMIAVVSSDAIRQERLEQRKGIEEDEFRRLSATDFKEEGTRNGQYVSEAILRADYFLANDYSTTDGLGHEADRLLRLAFGIGIVSPRADEFGMHIAHEAAARSACLSRQVGAALFSRTGTILATGCNDVPKFGGGLYSAEDRQDKRCWALGAKCYNDEEKRKITEQLIELFAEVDELKGDEDVLARLKGVLRGSRIKDLIEFSRAVHAEMDAMLAVARDGEQGLLGSTLYTTTYPCHNCAKHIITAGIRRVVYMEPYEKSLARKLHGDSINDPRKPVDANVSRVLFETYGGVAPKRYGDFFRMRPGEERKREGLFIHMDRARAKLVHIGAQRRDELTVRIQRIVNDVAARSRKEDTNGQGDEEHSEADQHEPVAWVEPHDPQPGDSV